MTEIQSWVDKFANSNVKIDFSKMHDSWADLITKLTTEQKLNIIELEKMLKKIISVVSVYPHPDLVFNAFTYTHLGNIKVVILGQDPYHGSECHDDKYIPQAMGLSFSVQDRIKVPPSLVNIYKNLVKFKHLTTTPKHGNLTKWAQQGCLLLNTSLTVTAKQPNSHEKYWKQITDTIIKYISDNTENIVFFLWGNPSLKKLSLIDQKKHKISISSHPSPLSYSNKLGDYLSFGDTDHFGVANTYLVEHNKQKIDWTL